jgi:hypothetical protein
VTADRNCYTPMVTRRSDHPRSGCAINAAVQVIGDRWSLLVLRDVMFGNRRHFRVLQIVEQWHRQGQVTDGTAVVRLAVKRPDRGTARRPVSHPRAQADATDQRQPRFRSSGPVF